MSIVRKIFKIPEPKYSPGDLLIYNPEENFGDGNDRLIHLKSRRFGVSCDSEGNWNLNPRWYYNGYALQLKESQSLGVSKVPIFSTGIFTIPESNLTGIENILDERQDNSQ